MVWEKPDGKIQKVNTWRYSVLDTGDLRVRAIQQRHAGNYVCRVYLNDTEIMVSTTELNVLDI